ncbi:MAG: endo alpha-1,4 polygalactosaminidase [Bacteroidia bacterium]|nr:endo alpha-1,4 polygalactosaminidase [Bacteroidia bacterium]
MKKILAFALVLALFSSCRKTDPNAPDDYKQAMRDFVESISVYTKNQDPNFLIIPQNGQELVTTDGTETGSPEMDYLQAIDGVGREDLFYGYNSDDQATPIADRTYMMAFLDVCEANSVEVLTTDYTFTSSKMDDSYAQNEAKGYISFAAPDRELRSIPGYPLTPYNVNSNDITNLSEAKNFLYLLNPENYASKSDFISAVSQTNYDLVIMDYFFNEEEFSANEISQLKTKKDGGQRLVISYMSIGEAENYRYYWQSDWNKHQPDWLDRENPKWKGNYKVWYWDPEWQAIITGNTNSYVQKILDAGFDGVYLDIIDAFEYYE